MGWILGVLVVLAVLATIFVFSIAFTGLRRADREGAVSNRFGSGITAEEREHYKLVRQEKDRPPGE